MLKKSIISFLVILNLFINDGECFQWSSSSGSDRVRLTDVSTITLHSNQLTTGRRSSPVPQLQCVGGTAGCRDYLPKAVQCYNRGSDGNDVQWECKAEMDNAYQFGRIQVSCEGYDYPDDPYVLKGSCGLEYELDLTRTGRSYDESGSYHHHHNHHYSNKSGGSFGDIIMLVILVAVGYGIYKSCIASRGHAASSYQSASSYSGVSSGQQGGINSGTTTGGGFWTGAAGGGLLGYLFGRSSNYGGGGWGYGRRPGWGYGGGSGWGYGGGGWGSGYRSRGWGSGYSSGGSSSWSSSRRSGSSGGSRTTSGFGGTSRR